MEKLKTFACCCSLSSAEEEMRFLSTFRTRPAALQGNHPRSLWPSASLRPSRTGSMRAKNNSSSAAGEGELGGELRSTTTTSLAHHRPLLPLSSPSDPQQPSLLLAQLTTVQNARDLASAAPGLLAPGLLFRSACPAGCSDGDVSVLRSKEKGLGVRTLLDLRSDEERQRDPRCLLLHAEGTEVEAFYRAGVGAAPSSSSSSSGASAPPPPPPSLTATAADDYGAASFQPRSKPAVHSPTLPLGHVPADDPASPRPGEPRLVAHQVSLLDKVRFKKSLISEMPRKRDAAAVVGLSLLAKVVPSSLGGLWLAERSRSLAMDRINQGAGLISPSTTAARPA